MITPEYVLTMAKYNRWQNSSIFGAANLLDDDALELDRGAFFGSIRHTLNHLYWGDRLWMSRFSDKVTKPEGQSIEASLNVFPDWPTLHEARRALDEQMVDWAASLKKPQLDGDLSWYSGAMGMDVTKPLALCVVGFFNHQTHHRGQVHAMLTAAGGRPEDTDLFIMPETV